MNLKANTDGETSTAIHGMHAVATNTVIAVVVRHAVEIKNATTSDDGEWKMGTETKATKQ